MPIVVANANRAPEIGDIANAFVDKDNLLEIPIQATDADGNPLQLTISGLPRFASYTQESSGNGAATGKLRFAPSEGDRGGYVITVVAQDDGDPSAGSGQAPNQVLTQAKSFVLTVKSPSEAPVITAPRQVVAVVGQPLSVPLLVSDLDQDALSFGAEGLPIGAELNPQTPYGHALLTWTPTADDLGSRDIDIAVTDSGLPPQDAGYANPDHPIPNTTHHTLRVIVRPSNAAPELLGLMVDGVQVLDTGDALRQRSGQASTALSTGASTSIPIHATEGVPLTLELFGRDTDADLIDWSSVTLPRGMSLEIPAAGNGNHAILRWTPESFAAQSDNQGGTSPGAYRFTVQASDGADLFQRRFEIRVANINRTPRLLAMPLQLVKEGRPRPAPDRFQPRRGGGPNVEPPHPFGRQRHGCGHICHRRRRRGPDPSPVHPLHRTAGRRRLRRAKPAPQLDAGSGPDWRLHPHRPGRRRQRTCPERSRRDRHANLHRARGGRTVRQRPENPHLHHAQHPGAAGPDGAGHRARRRIQRHRPPLRASEGRGHRRRPMAKHGLGRGRALAPDSHPARPDRNPGHRYRPRRLVHSVPPDSRGQGEEGSFDLLGFTHYWGKSQKGHWVLKRKTAKDRFSRALKRIKQWSRTHRHEPLREQFDALGRKLKGHYGYYGIIGNRPSLYRYRMEVIRAWIKWLGRRSQRRLSGGKALRLLQVDVLPEPPPWQAGVA